MPADGAICYPYQASLKRNRIKGFPSALPTLQSVRYFSLHSPCRCSLAYPPSSSPSSPVCRADRYSSCRHILFQATRDHLRLIAFHPLLVRSSDGLGRGAYTFCSEPHRVLTVSPPYARRVFLFRALRAALSRSGMRTAADEFLAWEVLMGLLAVRYWLVVSSILRC